VVRHAPMVARPGAPWSPRPLVHCRPMTSLGRTFSMPAFLVAVVAGGLWIAPAASAVSGGNDAKIAAAGALVASDLPSAWSQHKRDTSSDKATAAAAAKIPSCKAYRSFRQSVDSVKRSRVESPDFELGQSTFNNTVNVFASEKSASQALAMFGSSSIATCTDKLFTVLFRQQVSSDKKTAAQVKGIAVDVQPYDITNYGDDTVAYEGSATVTFKDGTTLQIGLGNTAVRVGRAVSDYSYTLFEQDAVDALSPAVEASIARLQAAL
jgi:hypothetical protein